MSWTVIAGRPDAVSEIGVEASAHRYGETFTTAAADRLRLDGTPPRASISTRRLRGGAAIRVRWGARDPGSGVRSYDVLVAAPSHRARVVKRGTRSTVLTFRGRPSRAYRFLVRASDRAGNVSRFARTRYVVLGAGY